MSEVIRKEFDNRVEYSLNGKLHRLDGPAIIWGDNGDKEWYKNGKLHRLDGPACECYDDLEWWVNGKLHRIDGPACEHIGGKEYWVRGVPFQSVKEYWTHLYDKHYISEEELFRKLL